MPSLKANKKYSFLTRAIAFLLLLLLVQEVSFRFLFPLPEGQVFNRCLYMPSIGGDSSIKAIRSINVHWHSEPDKASSKSSLNRYGFRDKTWTIAKDPQIRRVAFLGDSFTEGLMAADEETIPQGFEKSARAAGDIIETMNFGVGGLEVEQYFLLLLDAVSLFRPKQVVVVVFANDLSKDSKLDMRVPVPLAPYPWWKPRLWQLSEMLKANECLPMRWNIIDRPFFYPIDHPANPLSKRVKKNKDKVSKEIYEAMVKGRFPPMRVGGSAYLKSRLKEKFDLTEALGSLKEFCSVYGAKLYFVYLPDRAMVTNYYKKFEEAFSSKEDLAVDLTKEEYHQHRVLLAKQCAKLDLPFLDLTPLISQEESKGKHLYWQYDDHMRGFAYLQLGEAIYKWLVSLPGRRQ